MKRQKIDTIETALYILEHGYFPFQESTKSNISGLGFDYKQVVQHLSIFNFDLILKEKIFAVYVFSLDKFKMQEPLFSIIYKNQIWKVKFEFYDKTLCKDEEKSISSKMNKKVATQLLEDLFKIGADLYAIY